MLHTLIRGLSLAWAATSMFSGCDTSPSSPASSAPSPASSNATGSPGINNSSAGSPSPSGSPAPLPTSAVQGLQPSSTPIPPVSPTSPYAACPSLDPTSGANPTFSQQLGGPNIVQSGNQAVGPINIAYSVTVAPSVSIQASLTQDTLTTALKVVSANPSSIQSQAQQTANQSSLSATTTFVSGAARTSLGTTAPTWANIYCTLQAASQIASSSGGSSGPSVTATFDPPIPNAISPLAQATSYTSELANTLTFNSTATVTQSTNSAVTNGATYSGTITVQSASPTLNTTTASGQTVNITADVAYTVTANFGSEAITSALGLMPSTTFYIDATNHLYKAVVATVNDTAVPQIIFTSN